MRTLLLLIIAIAVVATCSHTAHAADTTPTHESVTSIAVDTSPAAVEAAYQAVRQGDATPVASLKDTAESLLVRLINAAVSTGEFIADQIPIVIKELMSYYTALYVFKALLCLPFFYLGYWMFSRITRQFTNKEGVYDPDTSRGDFVGVRWFALVPYVVGMAVFVCAIPPLLKITLAPRVWLIEYAASLVK
jgi:hypothetical protein